MAENEIYAQTYAKNIMQLAQQKESKLYSTVFLKTGVEGKTFFQDQIGAWSMSTKAGRHSNTPATDPGLARRMCTMIDYNDAKLLDREDELKIISDPKSTYTIAAGQSMGRQIDDVIIAAPTGTAYSGETGTDENTLASANTIEAGSSSLTLAKVLETKRIFDEGDVDSEDRFFIASPQGMEGLLGVEQATSSDYASVKALVRGEIDTWLGFKWIMSTRLALSSTTRTCIAYQRSGICLGMASQPYVRTSERDDKCYSWQLYYSLHMGAVRLEEPKVVKVNIIES